MDFNFFLFGIFISVAIFIQNGRSVVIKRDVPYEFLVTRTYIRTFDMNTAISVEDDKVFTSYCKSSTCFGAVFNNSEKMNILTNHPSSKCTQKPSCIGFTKENYDYTIIFSKEADVTCNYLSDPNIAEKAMDLFRLPTCPDGWFGFTRSNNREWCWMFKLDKGEDFGDGAAFCQIVSAELNGFQTKEERDYFFDILTKTRENTTIERLTYDPYMLLGASRVVDCDHGNMTCAANNTMRWVGNVSTNDNLANDLAIPVNWDGSGRCLSLRLSDYGYDDMACTSAHIFSCGKYADNYGP